jgi:hypothetical protein
MATIEALCNDIVAEQAQQRAVLSSILRLLERGRGPRDAADVALLMAVAEAVGDRPFTSAALIVHAQADPALRERSRPPISRARTKRAACFAGWTGWRRRGSGSSAWASSARASCGSCTFARIEIASSRSRILGNHEHRCP